MVNVLIGAALGFLSGLGIGGGSLLLLWLTLVAGMAQSTARLINLMFFLPCALVSTVLRWRGAKPDWRIVLFAIVSALAGAYLGVYLGKILKPDLLKTLFGILFLVSGFREIRAARKK